MGEDFEGARSVDVNGATLAYLERGQGEPVVFVHGSASDTRTWHAQFAATGATHRAIVYSRRYARPNQPIAEGADDPMLAHVDDLVRFLRQVDAVPAHLVGHSWGGFVSTPPRPSELFRTLLRRPRTAREI